MAFRIGGDEALNKSTPERTFWKSERERWQAEYVRRLRITDTLVVSGAVAAAQAIRFGGLNNDSALAWTSNTQIGYSLVSVVLALLWIGFLTLGNTWSANVIGSGPEEYRRLIAATMRLFGLIAIISLLLRMDFARGYLAIAFPVGLIGLLISRRVWRRIAMEHRKSDRYLTTVLVVGRKDSARQVVTSFDRDDSAGYRVVGVCTPRDAEADDADTAMSVDGFDIPIVGDESSVLDAVQTTGADTVVVAATESLGAAGIRDLVWKLAPLGVDIVVTPGLVDVADQRLSIRPVANFPLLRIEKPQYDRAKSFGKAAFDVLFAALALFAIAPVMLAAAIAIKATSRGPVFYKSERMGLDGKPFRMVKFRSMFEDADKHLDALLAQTDGNGVLFKMREDPRVTPVGRVLRKYSLDELPQFINVLKGDMSVVGPRPPLRSEVERYDMNVRRRLLVRPGVTGLWQVSGRSDLSWDESVRLDLSYVENWSMVQDLLIIRKTITAVARSDGAY